MLNDQTRKQSEAAPLGSGRIQRPYLLGFLCVVLTVIALLPWWRNHAYLRDFYDYGLFINVNSRLAEGQRPFVDFVTPAQSANFLLNFAAERISGGTYLGMTWGAAVLIVAGIGGLGLLLARRFGPWTASLIAGAVVIGSASQHTIIFYNPIGVFALALVGWSFAVAPLLRRSTLGWHAIAALGLFVGGLNKINFHLIGCALAGGWIVWGWVTQRAALKQAGATLLFVLFFGFGLPLAVEMAWTGANWSTWYYNVVQLPLSARGGRTNLLLSSRTYLATLHDYYGEIRLPQIGLICVVLPLFAIAAAWKNGSRVRRVFASLAGVFSALAGIALLLTNNEIAYVTFSAAMVLMVSLWLGFRLEAKGFWFALGVLAPALLLGVLGWESAWRGQRSQFGHSAERQSSYIAGEQIGSDFSYLRGTFLPAAEARSLTQLAAWRQELTRSDRERIFYGPGVEWLDRIWPEPKVRGLPLLVAGFDGERETALLEREVLHGEKFRYLLVNVAWDHWSVATEQEFPRSFTKEGIGTNFYAYGKLPPGTVWARPLEFNVQFGGNVDPSRLISSMPLMQLADGRGFLGTARGPGELELTAPSRRIAGEAVLRRLAPAIAGAAAVRFRVYAKNSNERYPRWQQDLVLPEGTDELIVPTDRLDASGLPMLFTIEVPDSMVGKVAAGWRALTLWDSIDVEKNPPLLQPGATKLFEADEALRAALLPSALADVPLFVRNAWTENKTGQLSPGGEVWVHLTGMYSKIELTARSRGTAQSVPRLKVIFYKGGRMEVFYPTANQDPGTLHFTFWSPENDGWLGILADPDRAGAGCAVRIEAAHRP